MAVNTILEKNYMSFQASMAAIYALFWIGLVYSYQDLKNMSCKNASLFQSIPPERAIWYGSVTITMSCDENYDLPLNAPQNSTLTCLPDGSAWKPDFLPDCNEKMFPSCVDFIMSGDLSYARCSDLGKLIRINNIITFISGSSINITEKCDNTMMRRCILMQAYMRCNDSTEKYSSNISIQLKLPLLNHISWNSYTNESENLAIQILRSVESRALASDVTFTVEPKCKEGTVAVLQNGTELVCRGCSAGHYLDVKTKTCVPCKPGYYGDSPIAITCKPCPGVTQKTSSTVWEQIKRVIPGRAHDLYGCPLLYRHANGTIEAIHLSRLNSNRMFTEAPKNVGSDNSNNEDVYMTVVATVFSICATLIGIFLALTFTREISQLNRERMAQE